MSLTSKKKKKEVMKRLSKETGYNPETIRLIIKYFFIGVRRIMKRNGEISIHGLFKIILRPYYKKKVLKDPNTRLYKRRSDNKKNRKK